MNKQSEWQKCGKDSGSHEKLLMAVMILVMGLVVHQLIFRDLLISCLGITISLPGRFGTTISMFIFSLISASYIEGWRLAALFFVISAVVSWMFEHVGVATGVIYGSYHYTDYLGVFVGHVPIIIPVAWFMFIWPSFVIANLIVAGELTSSSMPRGVGGVLRLVWLSAIAALAMTAWDLTVDPVYSMPGGAWVWHDPGPYFGVPLQNFVGWFITTFSIYLTYSFIRRRMGPSPLGRVTPLVVMLPIMGYTGAMLRSVLWGEPAALRVIAPFAMGIPVLIAVGRYFDALYMKKSGE